MAADPVSFITYFARKGYWRHASTICLENLKTRPQDPVLSFWRALSIVKEGSVTDGIRDLDTLQQKNNRDLSLAVPIALIYAHRQCNLVDQESIDEAQALLDISEQTASERGFLIAAQASLFCTQPELAKKFSQKLIDSNSTLKNAAHVVAGWVALEASDAGVARASQHFDTVLAVPGRKELDALLGRAAVCEKLKKYSLALDSYNQGACYLY